MSTKFDNLTIEQINLISKYLDKWKTISLSTQTIDRDRAEKVVNLVYKMLGHESPHILFFDSPYGACNFISSQLDKQLSSLFGKPSEIDYALHKWFNKFSDITYSRIDIAKIYSQIEHLGFAQQFDSLRGEIGVWERIDYQIGNHIWQKFDKKTQEKIQNYFGEKLYRFTRPGLIIANTVCQLDYLISNLDLHFEDEKWETYKSMLQLGNYIFPHEKICIVCNRPIQISFDTKGFLHGEGKPAIQFADGYCLYSYHAVTLPEKYGKVNSKQWQPKWLLMEKSCEIREVLVKGIGYAKLSHELPVKEIDCWQNFMLLAIEICTNHEITYLLEVNVDNGEIERVKEVSSNVQSVQEAASFVDDYDDWDIASAESKEFDIPF